MNLTPANLQHPVGHFGAPPRQLVQTFPQLLAAQAAQRRQPIVSLRDALAQLRLIDQTTLDQLAEESPDLLRDRKSVV